VTHSFRTLAAIVVLGLLTSVSGRAAGRDANLSDAEIENFLLHAKVVEKEDIGSGITHPVKLELELDGRVRKAAFKTVDIQSLRLTRFAPGRAPSELNFKDDYRYERAAYLLDRILGLDMVPVAVLRKIDGTEGAVIDWVSGAINEKERIDRKVSPPDPVEFVNQQAVMRLFDALILNVDRNAGNELVTTEDWKVHLIDHSRAFRFWKDLPDEFLSRPASLPRGLLAKLEALEDLSLFRELKGLLSHAQVKAMLERRDKILEKIAADRERYGEALVFQD
jgi:hypothetical protein